MAWLTREKAPLLKSQKSDAPTGLWLKCKHCAEIIFRKEFEDNMHVCPKCQHHFPLPAVKRVQQLLDPNTFEEFDSSLASKDPLKFEDTKAYSDRLATMKKILGRNDAFLSGKGLMFGRPVHLGVFDFEFIGGSMGSVVGEKIKRLMLSAAEKREPLLIVSSSGGARMQEGIISLMQMAKTCAALTFLKDRGVPFISILADPTTGGVAASYAMLGDVNIGEPGAIIGFAGPRVIEQTIRQKLPEGFQRSEYLLEHGMLDLICHREILRPKIYQLLDILSPYTVASSPS